MIRWVIEVNGAPGTLYAGEMYQLQVDFPEHYPMEAPQVFVWLIRFSDSYEFLIKMLWNLHVGSVIEGVFLGLDFI